ncbi:hypothetical protein FE257_000917 [Aspergillus nanangensis]|uniref:Uncharacterized protein n=1 Tax=Aspergillus nanangensis TaxID=2582783 RepID=A0AAD4CEC1_ASPNN|nr:hypothetical protein FE257_000917 [Aspergillus nanangensis]
MSHHDDSDSPSVLSREAKQPFPPLCADDLATAIPQDAHDNTFPSDDLPMTSPLQAGADGEEEDEDDDDDDDDDLDFQSHYSLDNQSLSDASTDSEGGQFHEDGLAMHHAFQRSTSSLHGPNTFAPPFYNRPPTPLPPSPSLTSLLRPPFSTTTSRPTTPDSSDVETPNDTEAAVAKSARRATTVPRASPKVPTYEYYGFVLYLASSLAFCKFTSAAQWK